MVKPVLLFIFIVLNGVFAQTSITGSITDKDNGDPLIGANVILKGTTMGAASDVKGIYTIPNVPAGPYVVTANYIGYETVEKEVMVMGGTVNRFDFELVISTIQMETYVVTASRRRERVEDAPAAISVITKQDIRRESNTNLGDYLKTTKGLDFTQSGIDSYNITARGFNSSFSSRLMTLTDGRMANIPSLRLTAYNVIPVSFDDVEQIEIVLGPSSALYGPNAHSGVLNIISSSPLRSQGTSLNIMGGTISQADTDPLQKITFRTAHSIGKFGFKVSGVVLRGSDWKHINSDEYEGHDPAFLGRPSFRHDRIAQDNVGELNSPLFTQDMLSVWEGSDPNWVGLQFGDGISNGESEETGVPFHDWEPGSPIITQEIIDEASTDQFNRYHVPGTNITLWNVTEDMLGHGYSDGIDNNGNGEIDEGIDEGIDDFSEVWLDGVDNDNDGIIDEEDEQGSTWLGRFGSFIGNWTVDGGGFGDYEYDEDGNILFDSNKNDIYGDNWGNDGIDNDGDWAPYFDEDGNPSQIAQEEFEDLNLNGIWDEGEFLADANLNGIWDAAEPYTEQNGVEGWQNAESYTDNNGNGVFDGTDFLWTWTDWDGDGEWDPAEPYEDSNGDGEYSEPEYFVDSNGNGVWDPNESLDDTNGNGVWDQFEINDIDGNGLPSIGEIGVDESDEGDFNLNYGNLPSVIMDANDDGIDDFPDFNVRNYRYDIRADWEPNDDVSLSVNHGYAYARNINITPIARYLADGWIYRYYQGRLRYKNLFFQTYLNSSYSGDPKKPTRSLATGRRIYDRSKKFSAQLQHALELFNGNFRFVWGLDYFLTLPDTRGTILSDRKGSDLRDNNGNGEGGSLTGLVEPLGYIDYYYDPGVDYLKNKSDILTDTVQGAFADGLDNDGDSDDFSDLNDNGVPDYVDENGNGICDYGEAEPGVRWAGGSNFFVYADGIDNNGDGDIDENIDEGIDEPEEDNRYVVNELGLYYQINWKISDKFELIQATRFDVHDRLSDFLEFDNQKDYNYSPLKWEFNFDKTDGIQVSPKIGLAYKPREHQNFRLTWAQAFNTPSNNSLFLDIYITRVSIFKVYARGADGGYNYIRNQDVWQTGEWDWIDQNQDNEFSVGDDVFEEWEDTNYNGVRDEEEEFTDRENPLYNQIRYFNVDTYTYSWFNPEKSVLFYPSVDPKIKGYYRGKAEDLPGVTPEIVQTLEFGYKGRLAQNIFGTLDVYASHYNSFVSGATFITPIILDKFSSTSGLEIDHNNNGITNNINDMDNNIIADPEDLEESLDGWLSGLNGITAMEEIGGSTPPIIVGFINYGEVDLWGLDASLAIFLNREWSLNLTYSHLGMNEFLNPITNAYDPINAPRHKAGMQLQYIPRKFPLNFTLNARYVDAFRWSSGIYYGQINAYTIFDLHSGYEINDNLKINLTINNVLNHKHTEIMGGPAIGQMIVLRLQASL